MNKSESLFRKYLNEQRIGFSNNFLVNSKNNKNVDFRLARGQQIILCDVKEINDSKVQPRPGDINLGGSINAQDHIRGDIKKLRQKFDRPPTNPLLLVSMNFSSDFLTALTVARALMGEIGIVFERKREDSMSYVHHLQKGNASLRQEINTSISGVFFFDIVNGNHYLFRSPYAKNEMPSNFFLWN